MNKRIFQNVTPGFIMTLQIANKVGLMMVRVLRPKLIKMIVNLSNLCHIWMLMQKGSLGNCRCPYQAYPNSSQQTKEKTRDQAAFYRVLHQISYNQNLQNYFFPQTKTLNKNKSNKKKNRQKASQYQNKNKNRNKNRSLLKIHISLIAQRPTQRKYKLILLNFFYDIIYYTPLFTCQFMLYSLLLYTFIIIMLLNIRKIGKAKHKFKAKLSFIKITNQSTQKGISFKVKIERGSHEIEAVSQPSRKGTAKFANSQYVIPMTLFCDEDEKQIKYLQKQATIKAFQCDQNGKQIRKIGQKTMDLSQYASRGMLKLEIQLDPAKKIDSPIIILQIFLQRQDDDSKSVDTYSSNNDKKNEGDMDPKSNRVQKKTDKKEQRQQLSEQLPNKKEKPQNQKRYNTENNDFDNAKQKDSYLKPPTNKARNDRKMSEDKSNDFKKRRDVDREQQFEDVRKQMERQQEWSRDPYKVTNNMIPLTTIGSLSVQQRQPAQKIKSEAETQFTKGESPQLQIFLLKKAVKDKQSELSNMKRQNENLKKTIDKLVQESSSAKQVEKRTGFERQVQDLKKALTSKDIEIDKLTTANKALSARQQQYEKTIVKLRQEAMMSREKISDMKYRQAFLMQQLFQTANKEALEEASRFLSV